MNEIFKLFDKLVDSRFFGELGTLYPIKKNEFQVELPKGMTQKHIRVRTEGGYALVDGHRTVKNKKTNSRKTQSVLYKLSVPENSNVEQEFSDGKLTLKFSEQKKEQR